MRGRNTNTLRRTLWKQTEQTNLIFNRPETVKSYISTNQQFTRRKRMRFGKLAYVWFEKGTLRPLTIIGGHMPLPDSPSPMDLMGINTFLCVCLLLMFFTFFVLSIITFCFGQCPHIARIVNHLEWNWNRRSSSSSYLNNIISLRTTLSILLPFHWPDLFHVTSWSALNNFAFTKSKSYQNDQLLGGLIRNF